MRTIAFATLILAAAACSKKESPSSTNAAAAKADKEAKAETASISVKGSDTMVILGQRWAEAYMKEVPGSRVQVTGGGSGTGIAALINGSTDVCESSRPMKDKEKADLKAKRGQDAIERKVALDALAIYVNAKSPIAEISVPAAARIYRGEAKNWKEFGGPDHVIVLYGRENNSGTYGYFKEHVLENKDFAANVQTLAGTSAVVHAVKGDEFGIGYGGIAYLEGVRPLKVKKDDASPAIAPNLETAQSGSYPVSRFLYFYTAGEPTGSVKRFVDWVTGPAGQKVIGDVGYYPLPKG